MTETASSSGKKELQSALRRYRVYVWAVALFSAVANLLMLTGPLYMLQVYDRVLSSGSVETLVGLTLIVVFLYVMMGALDYLRGRILARVAARLQTQVEQRVFHAALAPAPQGKRAQGDTALADLEAITRFLSSPACIAILDLPWTPIFLAGISFFHPLLGLLALCGGGVLVLFAILNQILTRGPAAEASQRTQHATALAEQQRSEAEMLRNLGMQANAFERWRQARQNARSADRRASDMGARFNALIKVCRLILQSAMLGLGAYLVLHGQFSAGAMIAGSILLGRALAPVEALIANWQVLQRAQSGWASLARLLSQHPPPRRPIDLPKPGANLVVDGLTIVPPGQTRPTLRLISFSITPGQAVGVIGPSAAGKSTLARAITANWAPVSGTIRLGGAALDQYAPEALSEYIGYLPQRVQLFDGTIAENIARLSPEADATRVVAAAKRADAHDMIVGLPHGYDTQIDAGREALSGGQIQRIALARALYSEPLLVVLDEPNSNLDHPGAEALNAAIRALKAAGRAVLIMAHRPAAIRECDMLMLLDGGTMKSFGPRDTVLRNVVSNHTDVQPNQATGLAG
ncbi:type I secretion system permease/ATPase [Cognatishimia sp. SS12]|uniref:type I secretion system permease/ATPase n=1 Tax=Cognatishimia sp. SS12 TaxID=2979465 RepID=UPI00232A88D8|nr:type I secretion system permease/ATPase [Cognatishimia sp. SS12]MDC0737583.1 type I secretion system permease/ATPase [Cognatishimia sp. SS12]